MKSRAAVAGVVLFGGVCILGYLFATGRSLNHEITYLALLAGFIISDRVFWPNRKN